ncbi:DUF6370 family protein [Pedobacter sp. AW1-32]|uniref:DUF6370 family protein n=1 Tax=Pedobacter sp. AW1-32 TaxID=3383026 RepID=UPI003FF00394
MKTFLFTSVLCFFSTIMFAQTQDKQLKKSIENKVVEIACGECQFKMKGKDCDLAVRIDGESYFVDGKGIDDFGDAHGQVGFCNAIRKAEVTGEIVKGRFKAKTITLLPAKQ